MSDQVVTVTVKGVGDFSDVVSNVGSVQKALTKLKLPDKLGDNLNKNITAFYKEYEKYQQKIAGGLKTQGDYNQVEKSLNTMRNLYQAIGADAQKLLKLDMKDLLKLDTGEFKKISDDITNIMKEIGSFKIDMSPFTKAAAEIRNVTKNSKISGDSGLLNQIIGSINTGQIAEAKKQLQELQNYANKVAPRTTASGERMPGTLSPDKYQQLTSAIGIMTGAVNQAEAAMNPLIQRQNDLQRELEETKQKAASGIQKEFKGYNEASKDVERVTDSLKKMHQEEFSFNREAQNIDRQIQSYFGLSQMIRKVGDIARDAFSTVKELDAAMTETAVVTNFSVGDMWDMLPTYTAQANQLGSTIKDVYEAATLYYQQGLNTNQAMGLANETLKMARIAGLGAAEATDMMTAALRGFNMEINQQSAQKINDIYSELAAITASDTAEIGSAMERTASIANSANMEFATTSAFLAQMIETTREAPENLGTAMKTIVARFQEMKQDPTKLIDSEGVAMDANKVDKALKTIGVNLMNTKGEFRDLDDVFLDIASRWDTLSQGQQRYIATIAAGSRQQSRFIAMMSNYERTMELVDAANNSAGASQRQFEKTLDSMEAKLNKLKNAWDQFTMGLMNNQILKTGVDALTTGFTIVNKFVDAIGKLSPKPFEGITKSVLTLVTTLGMLNLGKKASRGLVMGGVGWWKGETSLAGGFASGWKSSGQTGLLKNNNSEAQAQAQGVKDGRAYSLGFNKGTIEIDPNLSLGKTIMTSYAQLGKKAIGWDQIQINKNNLPLNQIANQILPPSQLTDEMRNTLQKCIRDAGGDLEMGAISFSQQTGYRTNLDAITPELQKQYDDFNKKISDTKGPIAFASSINSAGIALQQFGTLLQNTPLAPFGALLSTLGTSLLTLGSTINWVADTFMIGMGKVVAAEGTAATVTKLLAGGFKELWVSMGPVGWVILGIIALYTAYKGLDAVIESNAEKLEKAENAAAAASEAYDSAKQETSELADSIAKIQETDSAFDNLVAGTTEFNEQLVTANEQILALIDKYPMLMEGGYVSTDKNGLMHISDEGFKAVKEYQKQIQANASAMNLIQTADLNAEENMQKAAKLRAQRGAISREEHEKNLRDADLLEQRAKAEVELARSNAIRTALSGKELRDTEALTAVYTGLYEEKRKAAEVEVNALDKHEVRQKYADYHGYTYNKSTKKIKDVEGNEIDYDDKAIEDEVIEQTVLLDFEANASSLEGVLNKLDKAFSSTLEDSFDNSSHFISDVLSSNIETNTDLLENVLESPKELQGIVDSLSAKEVEAILGLSAGTVSDVNFDQYKNDVVDLLLDRASDIADAQAQSYSQLAAMLAQSKGWTTSETTNIIGNKETIQSMLRDLTAQQANTLSTIGQTLQESVGSEAMTTFIRDASNIYLRESQEVIDRFDDIIGNINWDSAASRLEGYHNAIDSTDESIQKWGKDMRASADEANILGDAFDEFLGGDWTELSEKADDFKNAMGEIDGAGILQAAEQSKTLKSLLDSGEVSATGVAMALQGIEEGKYSIGAVDTTVLQLLSSLNRLADAAYEAHNIIEKFDAGIDTGEGEDFVKENAEKAIEYYDNGEFGNQQLQNYIKLAAGEERWNEALKNRHGDLQLAEKDLMSYVKTFKDGFQPAWDQMVAGKGINGQSLAKNISDAVDSNKISKELGNKFEKVKTFWDDEGYLNVDFGELSTSELEKYYEAAYGVSEEYAKLLVQDLANYDATVSSMLAKNDLKETVQSESFQREHMVNGQMILSDAQIQAFEAAGGSMEELARAAGVTVKELEKNQFHVLDKNGNRIDNTNDPTLLQNYIKTFEKAEKGTIQSLFETGAKELFTNNKLDLNKLIADTQSKGFDQDQAMQAAWQAYQRGEQLGQRTTAGETELKQGIQTYEEFVNEMNSSLETDKWVHIGEAIAQGAVNFFNKQEAQENEGKTTSSSEEPQTSRKPPGMPESDWKSQQHDEQTVERQPLQKLWDLIIKGSQEEEKARAEQNAANAGSTADEVRERNKQWWSNFFSEGSQAAAEAKNQKITGGSESASQQPTDNTQTKETATISTDLTTAVQSLTIASDSLNTSISNLSSAGDTLNTAGQNLTTAAAIIASSSPGNRPTNGPTNGSGTVPNVPQTAQPNQSSVGGAIVIDNSAALKSLDDIYQKTTETTEVINKGATFTIKVPGLANLTRAGNAAKKVTDSAGETKVSLSASITGSSSKDIDTVKKSVSGFERLDKSHTVKLKTSLTGASASSIDTIVSAIDKFHNRTDKTITLTTKRVTEDDHKATGAHNHGYAPAPPTVGSAARGSYGQLGPKGKGGMTLTGELGYEIAWIPSENRSMILGANGPQMVNLPGDAVVWTHEQSKKIMKQQAIPAGSHARTGRRNSNTTGGGGGGSTKTSGGGKGKGKDNDTKKTVKQLTGKISDWWNNISRKIDATQRRVDKSSKAFEDMTKRYGTTVRSIESYVNNYRNSLKQTIKLNQQVADKYQKQLNKVAGNGTVKKSVSYQKKVSGGKTKKANATVNLARYIKQDPSTGAYIVDTKKINKEIGKNPKKGKNMAKATMDAAEKYISTRVSRLQGAEDKITKAREEIAKLNDTVYETFYAWERSLSAIYVLSKQIELISGKKDIFSSILSAEYDKLAAGLGTAANSISDITKYIDQEAIAMTQGIQVQKQKQEAAIRNLQDVWSADRMLEIFKENPNSAEAQDNMKAYMDVSDFLKKMGMESLKDFNLDAALDALYNRTYGGKESRVNKTTDEKMKEVFDKLVQAQQDNLEALKASIDSVDEYYQKIDEYQGIIEDFEDTLISGLEEEMEAEIDELEKLDSSLKKAMDELLDGVKKKLDERRKKEDNQKTENELSQKQQRLAMLRADTAGGHAVEIAQLEKEIADSRQDYQRSLEDQLLDKLQDQADEASKQRQHQIEILEAQKEIVKSTDDYAAQIRNLLLNPETNMEQLREIYRKSQGYDNKGAMGQQNIDENFEKWVAQYLGALHGYKTLTEMNTEGLPKAVKESFDGKALVNIVTEIHEQLKEIVASQNFTGKTTVNATSREEMIQQGISKGVNLKALGVTAEEIKTLDDALNDLTVSAAKYKALGFSASDVSSIMSIGEALSGFSKKEVINGYGNIKELLANESITAKDVQNAMGISKKKGTDSKTLQDTVRKAGLSQTEMAGVKLTGKKSTIDTKPNAKGGNKQAHLNATGERGVVRSGSTLYIQNYDAKTGQLTGKAKTVSIGDKKLVNYFENNKNDVTKALEYAIQHTKPGEKINEKMKDLVAKTGIAGKTYKLSNGVTASVGENGHIYYNKGKEGVQNWNAATGSLKLIKYNKKDFIAKAKKKDNISREFAQVLKKNGVTKYATGGLADFTGPAWLDGTSSKPELVLNAQDTKNFMALKDVLSHVMSSADNLAAASGDAVFEINVNVDHLNNDYDVDRVVERVKKKIVQDSSYRNVTQVRKFR